MLEDPETIIPTGSSFVMGDYVRARFGDVPVLIGVGLAAEVLRTRSEAPRIISER